MLNTSNMAFIQSLSNLISHGMGNYKRDIEPSPYILSTSPPDSSMELYVLKHKLQVCTIPKASIKDFCHAIIKIALLPDSRPNFFSITETANEYTLIVTEDDYQELGEHPSLRNTGQLWRVLTVSVGAMGTCNELVGVSKIAKSVIGPLADHNVSVLCMSTYQSDFILVEDAHLDDTIKCLGSYFKIFNEDHRRVNDKPILSSSPQTPVTSTIRPIKHGFNSPEAQFHITGLDASKLPNVMQVLLELIFFPSTLESNHNRFFHFSMVSGDISLMLDNEAMSKFPSNSLYTRKNDDLWRAMIIGDSPLGFVECGICAQIVEPLATSQINTYYVSTFNLEYCMVLEKDLDRVLKLLDDLRIENIKLNTDSCQLSENETNRTTENHLDEKEDLRMGENLPLGEAIEQSNALHFNPLSTSPQTPMSDDSSSYGTSPPSDIDMTSQQNNNFSNPIPIPPCDPSVAQSFSKLKC